MNMIVVQSNNQQITQFTNLMQKPIDKEKDEGETTKENHNNSPCVNLSDETEK